MKILFVTPYPPGHIRVRSFHLVSQLLERGHSVTLAYPDRAGDSQSRVDELRTRGAQVITRPLSLGRRGLNSALAPLRRRSIQARYAWSPRLAQALVTEIARNPPDIVHVEHLRAVEYARLLADIAPDRPLASLWDSVDSVSALLAGARKYSRSILWRLIASLDLQAVRRYEQWALSHFDRVLCASEQDRNAFNSLARPRHNPDVQILHQGVDLRDFSFNDPRGRDAEVVFNGAMGYHANVAAALRLIEEIMPRVWNHRDDISLVIVGPNAPRKLRRAAARVAGRVRLTGWVPEVQPHLTRAAVAAIPLRYGAGVQNKLLQAMACGTPAVADPRTAAAVGAVPSDDLLIAESDQAFADQVLLLLRDSGLRSRLAKNARSRIETRFSWRSAGQALERHYRETLARR